MFNKSLTLKSWLKYRWPPSVALATCDMSSTVHKLSWVWIWFLNFILNFFFLFHLVRRKNHHVWPARRHDTERRWSQLSRWVSQLQYGAEIEIVRLCVLQRELLHELSDDFEWIILMYQVIMDIHIRFINIRGALCCHQLFKCSMH